MAVPTAPAAGEPIAEAWGDVVHDSIVAMDIQSGVVNLTLTATNVANVVVTFPRPFAAPPIVVACYQSTNQSFLANVHGAPTATQVTIGLSTKTAANVTDTRPVSWIAYGPRA